MSVTLSVDLTKLSDHQLIQLMSHISEVLVHRFNNSRKSKKHEQSHRVDNRITPVSPMSHKKCEDSNDHAADTDNSSVLDMNSDD